MATFDNLLLLTATLSQQYTGKALLLFHGKQWLRERAMCYVACTLSLYLVNTVYCYGTAAPVSSGGGVLTTVVRNTKLSNGDVRVLRLILAASLPWNRKERGF